MTATVNVIFGPSGAGKTTYAHAGRTERRDRQRERVRA